MVDEGCKAVVMEVSSQGLKLDRTAGIVFDIGVLLILSLIISVLMSTLHLRSTLNVRLSFLSSARQE